MDGDETKSGSEPSQTPATSQSASSFTLESEMDTSRLAMWPDSVKELKALQKDIKEKNKIISQLEDEIAQLKQKAKEKDEEYVLELANKEKEMNDHRASFEKQLKQKEEELKTMKTEAQASELQNQKIQKKLREELEQVIKDNESYKHSVETTALKMMIKDREIELEREKYKRAEAEKLYADLQVQMYKKEADDARKERDAAKKETEEAKKERDEAKKEADEAKKERDHFKREAHETKWERERAKEEAKEEEAKSQKQMPSHCLTPAVITNSETTPSLITQGMESMNLNSDAGPNVDPSMNQGSLSPNDA